MHTWPRPSFVPYAGIVLLAGLVFFTNLGSAALFDEDEPKNAVCGREMFLRGDWLVPTFNQDLRTDKPILIYWIMLGSYTLFGVNEFAARFGSSLMSLITAVFVYRLGRLLFDTSVGTWASLILCTCLMFAAVGRAATPDATLIACVTGTFLAYVSAVANRHGGRFGQPAQDLAPRRWDEFVPLRARHFLPFSVGMGLATLAKGPIGIVLPCAILVCFLLVMQQLQDRRATPSDRAIAWWRRLVWDVAQTISPPRIFQAVRCLRLPLVLSVALAVALPWYVAVGWATGGAWLEGFLGGHNVGRFLHPMEHHSGPFFYYLIVIALGAFPWSVFLPQAIGQLIRSIHWQFSAASRHADPTFPLAEQAPTSSVATRTTSSFVGTFPETNQLAASSAAAPPPSDAPISASASSAPAALVFLACWSGVWIVFFSCASTKLPNYVLPAYPALALLLAWYLQLWRQLSGHAAATSFRHSCRALGGVSMAALLGIPIALSILLPSEMWLTSLGLPPLLAATWAYRCSLQHQRSWAVRALGAGAVCLTVLVVGVAPSAVARHQDGPSWGQTLHRLFPAQQIALATYDYFSPNLVFYGAPHVQRLRAGEVTSYFQQHPHGLLITRADRLDRLSPDLPPDVAILARQPRFLRRHDLVLLGRMEPSAQAQSLSSTAQR